MPITVLLGNTDSEIQQIIQSLNTFEIDNPNAQIDIYRQNVVSVRIRIINPDFKTMNRIERRKYVWKYLNNLDEEIQSDISSLILLTPDETNQSFANFEFESPLNSKMNSN